MDVQNAAVRAVDLQVPSLFEGEHALIAALTVAGTLVLVLLMQAGRRGYSTLKTRLTGQQSLVHERRLTSVAELSAALSQATDVRQLARILLDGLNDLLGLDFAGLYLVDAELKEARGLVARAQGADVNWYPAVRLDLEHEISGVRRAVESDSLFVAEDAGTSPDLDAHLIAQAELQSALFVPLRGTRGIVGVISAGSQNSRRSYTREELALAETVAGEGALALERTRSASALERTLERERLVAEISRQARSELDVNRLIEVALAGTAKALGVSRCFLRLVESGGAVPVRTVWLAEGVDPIPADHAPVLSRLALEEHRAIAVDDIASDEELAKAVPGGREVLLELGTRAGLATPIVFFDTVIGVLVAHATEPRRWTADDISFVEAIGREFGVALHTARALERERLVAEISRRARSELDVDRLIEIALAETAKALGGTRCFLRLGEPSSATPLRAQWQREGLEPVPAGVTPYLAVSNLALHRQRTTAVADVENGPELADDSLGGREVLLGLGSRAVLVAPIILFDKVIGALGVHTSVVREWSDGDIAFLEAIARELGIALHTAGLLEENQRRLEQQEALLYAAEALASELELDSMLTRLVEQAAELSGADAADCWILERGRLTCRAVVRLSESEVGREQRPLGAQLTAIEERRPVRARDLPTAVPRTGTGSEAFADSIVVPVESEGEIRGVLGIYARTSERFADVDSKLLDSFAEIASIVLRNAEAFAQRSRRARIERGFYRIAEVLGQSLSLDETVEAVGHAAGEALGGSFTAVLMPHGDSLVLAGAHGLPVGYDLGALLTDGGGELLRLAAEERRSLVSSELADDERFSEDWRRATTPHARSLMIVPIEQQRVDRCGLALVFFADRRVFDDDDLELARQLARAASGALERSELFENERRTRSLAERLASGRSTLVGAHDPAKLAEQAACQAAELCDADAAVIFMLDHGELVVRGCAGDGLEGFVGRRVSTGVSLAGEVVHSREPLGTARGGVEREMTQRSDPLLESGYAAFLGVPMGGRDETPNGVLAVYSRGERVWRTEEIEALSSLAAYAAAALEGAALYFRISLERERSLAILSSVEDGIVAVDRAGKIVLWNVAAERLTGVEASEALGGTPEDVLQRDLGAGSEALGERTIQIRRGEQEIWLALAEAVMRDPSGQVAGRIYTLRDVSSDRLVEQAKSDFVTSVSHGLRAPLASIYGFAETLLSRDELFDHEQRRTFLGYIVSESRRLTEIVNKLLDAAQLDAGELQVEIERTDVGALVGEVVESVRADSSANSHRFVVELADEPLGAEADSEKLRRVLINLVENAVKYSPADSTITLSARRRAGVVEVRVADEGVGIPVSERERVFRKFYRGGASGLVSGSGLGLFITRGLVNAMGGRIWVDSTESRGSTFTFELPSSSDEEA